MNLAINGLRLMGRRCGVGRYIEYLLRCWSGSRLPFDRILLYTPGKMRDPVPLPDFVEHRILASEGSNAFWEQVTLPRHHNPKDLLFCPSYVVPLISRARIVLTHLGSYEAMPEAFPLAQRIKNRLVYRASARRADRIITVSESAKQDIVRFYGVPEDKVKVIYLGVDESFRPLDDPEDAVRTRVAYAGSARPMFLFVGKLSRRRNIPQLVEAFARMKKSHGIPHVFLFVGPDTVDQNLEQLAAQHGVAGDVIHREYASHEELVHLYNASDLFLYPSSYEGFGIPVLEAMACGVPAIALRNTSFLEFADGAAYLAPEGSTDELYRAMETVLGSGALRRQMSEEGLRRASRFGWDSIAAQTLDVLAAAG
jgi:glycosyltransferase involved in cell wall biosynthesis